MEAKWVERFPLSVENSFTSECLSLFFTMISDYFVFKFNLLKKCTCKDIRFDYCVCSSNYVTTLRSFKFETIENDKLLAVNYEQTRKEKLDDIISQM